MTTALTHKEGRSRMGSAINQAIAGCNMSFAKLMPHARLGAKSTFCIKNKPIDTNAQGVAAAAKNVITFISGSYKTKSVEDQSKPATGAINNGFEQSDLITFQKIS